MTILEITRVEDKRWKGENEVRLCRLKFWTRGKPEQPMERETHIYNDMSIPRDPMRGFPEKEEIEEECLIKLADFQRGL